MRALLTLSAFVLSSTFAAAQSFNIDVGSNLILFPVPSTAYGAAAAQTGTWNDVHSPYSATLANLDGSPSAVTTASTSTSSYNQFPFVLLGDDLNLMQDIQDLPVIGGPWTWTFSGLAGGNYALYTYAWDPANTGRQTRVTVPGAIEPAQDVGGTWGGSPHVFGVTYALHHLSVTGGSFTIQVEGLSNHNGSVNGFQLVYLGNGSTSFCAGDGTGTACPCGNNGSAGNGCASSVAASGASLTSTGLPSIATDTLTLVGSSMPNSSALYFQGTAQSGGGLGSLFGDGLRCAAGSVIRLGTKLNAGGASSYPAAGDLTISVKGLNSVGAVRDYQCWYRNAAAFCTASTFNLTNGIQVTWQP
jgi:hypothetical protein